MQELLSFLAAVGVVAELRTVEADLNVDQLAVGNIRRIQAVCSEDDQLDNQVNAI